MEDHQHPQDLPKLLLKLQKAKAKEARAKDARIKAENALLECLPRPEGNSESRTVPVHANGISSVTVKYPVSISVSNWDLIDQHRGEFDIEAPPKRVIDVRKLNAVRELHPDVYHALQRGLVSKPGKPSVSIKEAK